MKQIFTTLALTICLMLGITNPAVAGTWLPITVERQKTYIPSSNETGDVILRNVLTQMNVAGTPAVVHDCDEFIILAAIDRNKHRYIVVIEFVSTQSDKVSRVIVHQLPDPTLSTRADI